MTLAEKSVWELDPTQPVINLGGDQSEDLGDSDPKVGDDDAGDEMDSSSSGSEAEKVKFENKLPQAKRLRISTPSTAVSEIESSLNTAEIQTPIPRRIGTIVSSYDKGRLTFGVDGFRQDEIVAVPRKNDSLCYGQILNVEPDDMLTVVVEQYPPMRKQIPTMLVGRFSTQVLTGIFRIQELLESSEKIYLYQKDLRNATLRSTAVFILLWNGRQLAETIRLDNREAESRSSEGAPEVDVPPAPDNENIKAGLHSLKTMWEHMYKQAQYVKQELRYFRKDCSWSWLIC